MGQFKNFFWQWRGVWITTPLVAVLVIILRLVGLLQSWEWAAFDRYMQLRPQTKVDDRIAIVGIDELDIENLGTGNIPDIVYARLLEKLKARKPRAIGLDIYRNLPEEPGYKELVQVFRSTPNLVGIEKVVGNKAWEIVPPPPELKAKQQVGANDLLEDADRKVRRSFLYVRDRNGKIVWSFATHLALHYLEKSGIALKRIAGGKYQLGSSVITPFEANDGGYVRADDRGYQILLNYPNGNKHFNTVSLTDVLSDRLPPEWGKDRIILIGKIAESAKDSFFTPYSGGLIELADPMTGVEIHAQLLSQMISAALDGKSFFKSWSEISDNLWILCWSGLGAILTWRLKITTRVKRFPFLKIVTPFLAAGVLLASTYLAFLGGWWIPVVPPLLSFTVSAIAILFYLAHSAAEIRKTFGRYLTDEIVANLLESPEGLKLGGERRKITVIASDLRGFTALSEQLSPEEVVKILNIYLGYMTDVITYYHGTIDKLMGDGILILFGAPTIRENEAERAVACAIAMQLAMQSVNEKLAALGYPEIEMGIGINTGEAVVGNIGSEKRTEYGVIGNQVNLAFRIETFTVGGQIFISESTFNEVKSIVSINGEKEMKMKGVKEPIKVYEVVGIGEPYNLFLPKQEEILLPLHKPIGIQYTIVEGKIVEESLFKGKLVKLSAKGAEVQIDNVEEGFIPPSSTNIKLNILSGRSTEVSKDIYAKVLANSAENGIFYIRFTAKPIHIIPLLEVLSKHRNKV
ncbi:CHASE2 domain-containing protein [Aerosakkonema funiforme]|uniref:CHASE2 domain-containing protein n=1 Tax=Aerosakkonema funiforme TaxID=1246630 RepID=UPI0035BA5854